KIPRPARCCGLSFWSAEDRKVELEDRSTIVVVASIDAATVRLDDGAGDGQPEAGTRLAPVTVSACPGAIGAVEALEHLIECLSRYSGSAVSNPHPQRIAARRTWRIVTRVFGDVLRRHGCSLGTKLDGHAACMAQGVVEQVTDHLTDPV